MRNWFLYGSFVLLSCGSEPGKTVTVAKRTTDTTRVVPASVQITASDTDNSLARKTEPEKAPVVPVAPVVKRPSGIYRFFLPDEEGKILHTIAFYPGTYKLQEEYRGKRDSTVVTTGTWAPSEGYIWIYKDQIARGRYTWEGDTLQYYSPGLKKKFPMQQLTPVTENQVWQTKKEEGNLLHGVGNEPFWSIDVTGNDSLVLNMPDWSEPVKLKVAGQTPGKDSTVFAAVNDSLKVIVYPVFCNDGMSDFLYTQKIKVQYRGQTYKGCGELLAPLH